MSAHRFRDPEYATRDSWGRKLDYRVGGQRRSKKRRLKKKIAAVWPGHGWRRILRRRLPAITPHSARVRRWSIELLSSGAVGRVDRVKLVGFPAATEVATGSPFTRAVARNATMKETR